jgi:hypothetical protein
MAIRKVIITNTRKDLKLKKWCFSKVLTAINKLIKDAAEAG